MVITVSCPTCSTSFPVDTAKIPEGGVNARCTSCGDVFRLEKPSEVAPLPTLEVPDAALPVVEEFETAFEEPSPAAEEAPTIVDSPDDWVVENEEMPTIVPEPEPIPDLPPPLPVPPPLPESDPFEEAAPFETAAPDLMEAPVAFADTPAAPIEAPPAEPEPATDGVQGFTFGKRDPTDKAKRLARVLVSDMIMYNAERHQSALAAGTLEQDFEEEIDKSWKEFVDQVGPEIADGPGRGFWTEALNDILAKGKQLF